MKRVIKSAILLFAFAFIAICATAQDETAVSNTQTPRWVSENGYWVVVRNINQPAERTIFFYNNSNQQVYSETVSGKLKLNKRKVLLQMKTVLETALIAWDRNQPLTGNEQLFAAIKNK